VFQDKKIYSARNLLNLINIYKFTKETLARRFNFDRCNAFVIICCAFTYWSIVYLLFKSKILNFSNALLFFVFFNNSLFFNLIVTLIKYMLYCLISFKNTLRLESLIKHSSYFFINRKTEIKKLLSRLLSKNFAHNRHLNAMLDTTTLILI